jgi:hypothetical protein
VWSVNETVKSRSKMNMRVSGSSIRTSRDRVTESWIDSVVRLEKLSCDSINFDAKEGWPAAESGPDDPCSQIYKQRTHVEALIANEENPNALCN